MSKKAHKSAASSGGKHSHAARHPSVAAAVAPPAPLLTPTLLLHHAAFKNDVAELRQLLALRQYDVNSVDVYGNTALHIAVMLGNTEIVEQLLQCDELKINLKNKHGFTPLSEATSFGDRALIGSLWSGYKTRARRSNDLQHFRTHLESLADFQATFFWRVESWVPFVTRFCPSDTFRLTKVGAQLRVDLSMMEFGDGMNWIKHPFSFVIHPSELITRDTIGNAEATEAGLAAMRPKPSEDGAAAAAAAAPGAAAPPKQPFVIYSLDHEVGKWQCLNMNEKEEQAEAERAQRRKIYEAKMAARHNKAAASAAAAAAPASPSSASGAAAAAAVPPAPEDVDLQYEIDDFQSAPISSAFSPGRLEFKPLGSRSWTSWSSWTSMIGVGVAPPRIERVGDWDARVWSVGGIRLHMLKRLEHLSKAEVAEMKKKQKHFRSLLGSPTKLKKAMTSKEEEEAEEDNEEDDDEEDEEEAAGAANSASSVADGASKVTGKPRKSRKLPEHRQSLPPPPASTIPFDRYFHSANQKAYRAVEMEMQFARQRDEALQAEEQGGAKVEVVELREEPEGKDDDPAAAAAAAAAVDADDVDVEDNEADAILQLEEQGLDSSPSASPPVSSADAPASSSMLLSESDSAPSYLHLGRRPLVTELTRQKYSARLWMSTPASGPGSFPLDMSVIVGLAHMLLGASYPQVVSKFEHFVTQEMPPGFPVRITVPLMSTISIDVSVQSFKTGKDIVFEAHGMRPPSAAAGAAGSSSKHVAAAFFKIPLHYSREEESEEEQHKRQQKYRKRWKAADADNKKEAQGGAAGGAGGAGASS